MTVSGVAVFALVSTTAAVTVPTHASVVEQVVVDVGSGTVSIALDDLQVDYSGAGAESTRWSAPSLTDLGTPSVPTTVGGQVRWSYDSGITVTAEAIDGRLEVDITSVTDRGVSWPVSPTGAGLASIEFANGEGQSIPVRDSFWSSDAAGLMGTSWDFAGGLTLPVWGATFNGAGVSYIMRDDIGSSLSFDDTLHGIRATAEHNFSASRGTQRYRVAMSPTDGNPVAAAQDYRRDLETSGDIVTLDEKIASNPEVAKLLGAFHAYTWGTGQKPEIVDQLTDLGITNAWLGYDTDPVSAAAVQAAKDAGFLVGPYDTWANVQDPETADTPLAIWPGLWPDGCVTDADGNPVTGFGGRGCYLSAAALAAADAQSGVISDRVNALIQNGSSSYFLDVDAVGELFKDFSPGHPMTEAEDRALRLERLERLMSGGYSNGLPLVVGSESAGSWASSGVDFSHGSSTPIANGLWAFERDKEQWGGYTPVNRPDNFFKPVTLPDDLATAMFDPRYRIPMYSTVLHDSVVTTDRWELGLYKFPGLVGDRVLTSMLYNTPLILALDAQVLTDHGDDLARFQRFFTTVQDAAGTLSLTSFERPADGIQRTTFGDGALTLTANFDAADSPLAQARCIVAEIPNQPTTQLCMND